MSGWEALALGAGFIVLLLAPVGIRHWRSRA